MIELLHIDCMDYMATLDDNAFDLAIVDPPYGIGDFNQATSRKVHKKIDWNCNIPSPEYFKELERVSINRIIWGANYFGGLISDVGRVIHDKTGGGKKNQLPELSDADIASHSFGVNIKIYRYVWQGNAQGTGINWNNTGRDARQHPCQKPVSLYEWLLTNYAKEGDMILDTHLGSGSSAIAAHYGGFDFVGCELDEDYFNAAKQRFEDSTRQLALL